MPVLCVPRYRVRGKILIYKPVPLFPKIPYLSLLKKLSRSKKKSLVSHQKLTRLGERSFGSFWYYDLKPCLPARARTRPPASEQPVHRLFPKPGKEARKEPSRSRSAREVQTIRNVCARITMAKSPTRLYVPLL